MTADPTARPASEADEAADRRAHVASCRLCSEIMAAIDDHDRKQEGDTRDRAQLRLPLPRQGG
jgi:hypothetical protein